MKIKFVGLALLAFCGYAQAIISLERSPLFVRPPVDPNIVLSFDDSGSMAYAVTPNETWDNNLPRAAGAGLCNWRDFPHLYAADANTQYFDPLVTYVPPVRADGTSFPDAVFTAAYLDGFAAYRTGGNLGAPTMNLATGYLPTMLYSPGTGITGTNRIVQFGTVATTNGCQAGDQRPATENANPLLWVRRPWVTENVGDPEPTFQRAFYYSYTGPRSGPNGKPTTFELFGHDGRLNPPVGVANYQSAQYKAFLVTPAQEMNFANWYSYYRVRVLMGRTAATVAFAQLPRNVRISWQGITNDSVTGRQIRKIEDITQRTNFYSYLHNVRATSGTPTRSASTRVGNYFSDAGNSAFSEINPYYDITIANSLGNLSAPASLVSCRQNYHMVFTDGGWKDDVASPFPYNGKNFDQTATTLPDGTAYPSSASATHTNIYTNGPRQAEKGGYADVAFDYWRRDLKSSLSNNVQPFIDDKTTGITGAVIPTLPANPLSEPEIYWNPKNDPATWQHVVQYVVAFGLTSSLNFPSDLDKLRRGDLRIPAPAVAPFDYQWTRWDNVENDDPNVKVDDTWHATLNSRGELLGASNPQELVQQMNTVFQAISARTSSVSAISISSSFLTAGTLSFRTFFKASSWSGSVQAERFLATGTKEIAWDAACRLDGGPCLSMLGNPSFAAPDPFSVRKVYSSNGSTAIDFTWASLSSVQQTALNYNWDAAAPDAKGPDRVAFLRGERALEGTTFRSRESVLGAVVNSNAVYVSGALDEYWSKDEIENDANHPKFPNNAPSDLNSAPETKSSFRAHYDAIASRTPMIYAGANDGMLHAFNATNGEEMWAYIPFTGYKELSRLTSKSKLFTQSSVDSTPVAREVYTNGSWRTMLVGAMRLGGQGVFALDITSPSAGTPASKFLWEFRDTSSGGADLGYTYGRPAITRLANKKWVVLLPGGYNSDETALPVPLPVVTDTAVGSGNAVLFVLDAYTGSLLKKIDLGPGTEGLSSVVAGDYIFDDATPIGGTRKKYSPSGTNAKNSFYNDEVTDVAFAGDNNGAMWRFNLEGSDPSAWSAVKMFQAAANQRITAQPRVVDPKGNGLAKVIFGTGRFITTSDRTNSQQQAIYGLFDAGPNAYAAAITQSQLQQKPVTTTAGVNGIRLVKVSNAAILSTKVGWWFNLPFAGERVIAAAGLLSASNRLIVSSFTPTKDVAKANDPCVENSESTLYVFNPDTGGPSSASIDTNGDGFVDSDDDAGVSGYTTPGYVGAVTPVTYAGGGNLGLLVPDPVGTPPTPAIPYCTANPTAAKCVACAADPDSELCKCLRLGNCPAGGLPTFIWRRTTVREIPAWDNNDL